MTYLSGFLEKMEECGAVVNRNPPWIVQNGDGERIAVIYPCSRKAEFFPPYDKPDRVEDGIAYELRRYCRRHRIRISFHQSPKTTDPEVEHLHYLMEQLNTATEKPNVVLEFRDGRRIDGAIMYVEHTGCGKLINIDREFSIDFNIRDLKDVTF